MCVRSSVRGVGLLCARRSEGKPTGKPDMWVKISDENFHKMATGKLGPKSVRWAVVGAVGCARCVLCAPL